MQLLIDADDNLDDVLLVLGQIFGRELQVAGPGGPSPEAPARSGKRAPATRGRAANQRGAARGGSATKRTAASRGKKATASATTSAASTSFDTSPVRAWARANGHAVNARGRLPASVLKAYIAAQR